MRSPMMGAITYLIIALLVSFDALMHLFRYSSLKNYYNMYATDTTGLVLTNWFKIGDLIINYTNMVVYGVAFITQLIALFGILGDINMLVWVWGVMVVGGLAELVGGLFYWMAYD